MARNNDRDRGKKRTPVRDTNRRGKPKVCVFCRDHVVWVDYKDVNVLRRFISDRAKIKARRTTGTCLQHQRDVAVAIKTARELALIPYTQRTVSDKAGGREGRGGGRGGPRGPRPDAARDDAGVADVDADVDVDAVVDDIAVDDDAVPAYSE
jgi:small subunit ribosomal protein S18